MRVLLCAIGLAFLVPIVTSQTPVTLGSEEVPELPDSQGDVNTTIPNWPGPKEAIDLTAAWLEYSNATDEVILTIRTADGQHAMEAPAGHRIGCAFIGAVTGGGQKLGDLNFRWVVPENRSVVEHAVGWSKATGPATGQGFEVRHRFSSALTAPGYFRFAVPRHNLTALGDQIENPSGVCYAFVNAGNQGAGSNGVRMAGDDASSKAAYSFTSLRQSRNAEGERLDPVERFERENATVAPTSSVAPDAPGQTPAVGAFGAVMAFGVAVVMRRAGRCS